MLDIVINKHNAACTGREQPCDLASLFRSLRQLMKKLLEGGSRKFGYDDTIKKVNDTLKKYEQEYGLNLGTKYSILVAFLVCLPDGVSQAIKDRDTLVKGFVKSGMNDDAYSGLPSFGGVLSTVTRKLTEDDKERFHDTFHELLGIQVRCSALGDDVLNAVGFPHEMHDNLRKSTCDSLQRAKTINSKGQNKIQKDAQSKIMEREEQNEGAQRQRNSDNFRCNVVCTEKILDIAKIRIRQEDHQRKQPTTTSPTEGASPSQVTNTPLSTITPPSDSARSSLATPALTATPIASPGAPTTEASILDATVEDFMSRAANIPFLNSFIIVRLYKDVPKKIPSKDVPKKKNELAQLTYDLRTKKVLVNRPDALPNNVTSPTETNAQMIPHSSREIISLIEAEGPSDLLNNVGWRKAVSRVMKGVKNVEYEEDVPPDLMKDAEAVYNILQSRFSAHFVRTGCEEKENHWTFQWAKRNLAPVIAAQALFEHLKKSVHQEATSRSTCLLAHPNAAMHGGLFCDAREEANKSLEGNYLYYNVAYYKWIRSGKACGTNTCFGNRDNQHQKCSLEPSKRTETFYKKYPDNSVETLIQLGKFQQLEQKCGLAFRRGDVAEIVTTTGFIILDWDPDVMEMLQKRVNAQRSLEEVQLDMASYQFEFVYQLCIGEANNVSESPCFEALAHTYS